jgi:hypothetical protein
MSPPHAYRKPDSESNLRGKKSKPVSLNFHKLLKRVFFFVQTRKTKSKIIKYEVKFGYRRKEPDTLPEKEKGKEKEKTKQG